MPTFFHRLVIMQCKRLEGGREKNYFLCTMKEMSEKCRLFREWKLFGFKSCDVGFHGKTFRIFHDAIYKSKFCLIFRPFWSVIVFSLLVKQHIHWFARKNQQELFLYEFHNISQNFSPTENDFLVFCLLHLQQTNQNKVHINIRLKRLRRYIVVWRDIHKLFL